MWSENINCRKFFRAPPRNELLERAPLPRRGILNEGWLVTGHGTSWDVRQSTPQSTCGSGLVYLLGVGDESALVAVPLGTRGVVVLAVELCLAAELGHDDLRERARSQSGTIVVACRNNDNTDYRPKLHNTLHRLVDAFI